MTLTEFTWMLAVCCTIALVVSWLDLDEDPKPMPVATEYALIIFEQGNTQQVTAGLRSRDDCDRITTKILEHGTSWDAWTCVELTGGAK